MRTLWLPVVLGPWAGGSIANRYLMLLSHPGGYGFGMYVLGEALMNRDIARRESRVHVEFHENRC